MHNNCVHQHFNASATKPARALVLKTKPMFMFMNMLFQKQVEPRPKEPAPGAEGFDCATTKTTLITRTRTLSFTLLSSQCWCVTFAANLNTN